MRLLSLILIASTFGIAGWAVAASLSASRLPAPFDWLSISAGFGAIAATFLVWPRLAGDCESLWLGAVSGLFIGVVAHPIRAFVSVLMLIESGQFGFDNASPYEVLEAVIGWSLCSLIGVGWISARVGAVFGLIIGAIYRGVRVLDHRRRLSAITDQAKRHELSRQLVLDEQPWDSWRAGTVSLAITSILSLSIVMQFADGASPEEHVPLMQKPAPLDEQAMDFSDDQQE